MQERVYIVQTPVRDPCMTSDLKQHLIDAWTSISQNVIDEATVGQCRKRLRANMRQKDITLNIC